MSLEEGEVIFYFRTMILIILTITISLSVTPAQVFGAEMRHEPSIEEGKDVNTSKNMETFIIYFENDIFANTDKHYTNAVKFTWLTRNIDRYTDILPSWSGSVAGWIPTVREAHTGEGVNHNIGFSLGHSIYTPANKKEESLIEDDRPYAGWFYGSIALHRKEIRHLNTVEIILGIVGPSAYGEEIQNTVHRYSDSPKANGWDNQLKDEPGFMLSWQRSVKSVILDWQRTRFDFIPHYGLTLGNVLTYANLGGEVRLGLNVPDDFGTALIRPGSTLSSPAKSAREAPGFGVHLFAGTDGRFVLRNIFIDGNTWRESHSVDKKNFVADLYAGIAMTYNRFKLTYTHVYRTREFKNEQNSQKFGSININYSF